MPKQVDTTQLANVIATYLQLQDSRRTVWQRLTAPKALPLSTLLAIVPLVLQILAALGITIPGFGGKTVDRDLDAAMGMNGVYRDADAQ